MRRHALGQIGIGGIALACATIAMAAPQEGGYAPGTHFAPTEPKARSQLSVTPAAGRTLHAPNWKRIRYGNPNALHLRSQVGLVIDEGEGAILYARDIDEPRPIASLTKLLTVMTMLDSKLPLEEPIEITRRDRDHLKGSRSRLPYGTTLSRRDLMRVALVASDNRAAAALARTYPGGKKAMVEAMNDQARALGLAHTRVTDASGLHRGNVSTARDLARLVHLTRRYPLIERWSTTRRFGVPDRRTGAELTFRNTNSLVHRDSWAIVFGKTGYTSEAGNCLIMRTTIADRPLIIVLLNSWGKLSKYGDSGRIRDWLLATERASSEREAHAGNGSKFKDI